MNTLELYVRAYIAHWGEVPNHIAQDPVPMQIAKMDDNLRKVGLM